jgi:hypothetical protein
MQDKPLINSILASVYLIHNAVHGVNIIIMMLLLLLFFQFNYFLNER